MVDQDLRALEREWRAEPDDFGKWRAWRLALKRAGITDDKTLAPRPPEDSITVAQRMGQLQLSRLFKIPGFVTQAGRLAAKSFRELYGCNPLQKPTEIPTPYGRKYIAMVYVYPMCDIEMVDKAIAAMQEHTQKKEAEEAKTRELAIQLGIGTLSDPEGRPGARHPGQVRPQGFGMRRARRDLRRRGFQDAPRQDLP